jgi:predicted dehydrogenase
VGPWGRLPLEKHPDQATVRTPAEKVMSTTERDIRWGILGPGFIAGVVAGDLARASGAHLAAVASRDSGRARLFAERHGAARYYGDYRGLAMDPDVDIVYVASPHSHHHEHAKLMLEHGKAVLVEKPFAMTADQADELVAIAQSRGTFLMEALWTLCNPLVRDLVARVRSGEIGTPRAFAASVGPIGGVPKGHRVEDPALGGSFMLECLVYPLSLLFALAPELADPETLAAAAVITARGVDTSSALTMSSAAGIATMGGGFVTGTEGAGASTFQLIGSEGWLQVDDNLFNPGRATLSSRGAPVQVLQNAMNTEGYRWEIEEASHCVRTGQVESRIVPLSLTLGVMRILDRGRAAAGIGRSV